MDRLREDRGAALIMVVLLGFVAIVLVGTGLTVSVSGLRQAESSERSVGALDAAFAGVQDYLARVDGDDGYTKYGNPLSKFTISSGSAGTVTPDATNPAFGVAATGSGATWAPVPGSGGAAKYRYEVDNSAYKNTGVIRLQVTGASGPRTRSLLVTLRVRGFVDYSYFTDYEIQDPQTSGAPDSCKDIHVWEGRPLDCGGVPDIKFLPADAVSGDVHSNDRMVICGATFTGAITTAYSGSPLYSTRNCSTTKPITNITHAADLPMPATNDSMQSDATCVYTGPTQITYNNDGTMTVVSPFTANMSGGAGDASACGAPGQLATTTGATVPQLDGKLLYVQNALPAAPMPSNYQCIDNTGAVTTASDGIGWQLSSPSGGAAIRYPLSGEAPATTTFGKIDPTWSLANTAYGCRHGDLYVKGVVTTKTTAASANDVYVIGNITYADRTADLLGLVGQNGVLVWNPMSTGTDTPMLSDSGREIDAAILSVAHTFMVQNYDRGTTTGTRGVLTVFGSIAQKYRGPVSATDPDTGYSKSYAYDSLLKTSSPPKFLKSTATSFKVSVYASVPSAFDSTGAPN